MASCTLNHSAIALSLSLAISAVLPTTASASEQSTTSHIRPVTVYFTRHAEEKTTTTFVGPATQQYQIPHFDNNPIGAEIVNDQPTGQNHDDVCGDTHCAQELTDKGLNRANLLASWFTQRGVVRTLDAVYSSHKHRTYQTVLPTATLADLDVIQLPAGATELAPENTNPSICPTINAIFDATPGDTLLIAGHHDTLYGIMGEGSENCKGLGLLTDNEPGSHRFPKDGTGNIRDYGDVWKVVIRDGIARFVYRVNLEATQLTVIDRAR